MGAFDEEQLNWALYLSAGKTLIKGRVRAGLELGLGLGLEVGLGLGLGLARLGPVPKNGP